MSARSQTQSVNGGSVRGSIKFAGEEAKDRMYEPKHKKKVVRVLTVVAYVFSVSLAAIMLSMYYIFIWQGTKPTPHHHHTTAHTECRHSVTGMNANIQDMSGGIAMYNESNIAETPRALPAREATLTSTSTPLSRLAMQYLQLHSHTDNFSQPSDNS